MNNSSSLSSPSAASQQSSKSTHTNNKNKDTVDDDVITINEKVNLTKHQHYVLKIICGTYQISGNLNAHLIGVPNIALDTINNYLSDIIVKLLPQYNVTVLQFQQKSISVFLLLCQISNTTRLTNAIIL